MPVHGELREEHQRRRREDEPERQDGADPEARHKRLRDGGERDDRERQGDVGDAGLDRRVVEHLLHVEREQEELREDRSAHQQAGDVRGCQRSQSEDAHGQ